MHCCLVSSPVLVHSTSFLPCTFSHLYIPFTHNSPSPNHCHIPPTMVLCANSDAQILHGAGRQQRLLHHSLFGGASVRGHRFQSCQAGKFVQHQQTTCVTCFGKTLFHYLLFLRSGMGHESKTRFQVSIRTRCGVRYFYYRLLCFITPTYQFDTCTGILQLYFNFQRWRYRR